MLVAATEMKHNKNSPGIFEGDEIVMIENATANKIRYEKWVVAVEKRFFVIIADKTEGKSRMLYQLYTNMT